MRGKLYASLMVRALSLHRSIQNLREPSFFLTKTTALAHGLLIYELHPSLSFLQVIFDFIKQMGWNPTISFFEWCIIIKPISCFTLTYASYPSFPRQICEHIREDCLASSTSLGSQLSAPERSILSNSNFSFLGVNFRIS